MSRCKLNFSTFEISLLRELSDCYGPGNVKLGPQMEELNITLNGDDDSGFHAIIDKTQTLNTATEL